MTVKTKLAGITGFRLDAMEHASLPAQGPGRAGNGNFVLNEVSVTAGDKPLAIARAAATFEQPGFSAAATLDGNTEKLNGWAVMGGTGVAQAIGFELAEPLGGGEELTLVFTLQQLHGDSHTLGRFRLAATTTPKPVAMPQVGLPPQDIVNLIQVEPAKRDDDLKKRLADYFRSWTPALAELRTKLAEAKQGAGGLRGLLAPLHRLRLDEQAAHGSAPAARQLDGRERRDHAAGAAHLPAASGTCRRTGA